MHGLFGVATCGDGCAKLLCDLNYLRMDVRDHLSHYWITFPDDSAFPIGQGVTAYSPDDAFALLLDRGYDFHVRAKRVEIREIKSFDDIDYEHVARVSGPLRFRGIWYPCFNLGIDASGR